MSGRKTLVLIPLLLWVGGCPSQQEVAEEAAGSAREALARGDVRAALEALRTLEANHAGTSEAVVELASLLMAAGEAPQALWLLEEGVRRHPDSDRLRLALARLAAELGSSDTAIRALEGIAPDSEQAAVAAIVLGQVTLRAGDLEGALEIFREAEARYPDQPQAVIARIGALLTEQRLDEAAEALASARKRFGQGEHADALREVEISFYSAEAEAHARPPGDPDGLAAAIEGLRGVLERYPGDVQAIAALANAHWRVRDVESALELVETSLAEDPGRVELENLLVPLLLATDRADEAESLLRARVEELPSVSAHMSLVRFLLQVRGSEAAQPALQAALLDASGNPLLERLNVEVLIALEDRAAVRSAVERYRSSFPDHPTGEYLQARLELFEGDAEAAVERLVAAMPRLDDPIAQHWLGQAHLAAGDVDAARRRFSVAIRDAMSDPVMYLPLIEIAQAEGNWREVAALAQRLVQLSPGNREAWATLVGALLNAGETAAASQRARRFAALFPEDPDALLMLARSQRASGDLAAAREALERAREAGGDGAAIASEEANLLMAAGQHQEAVELLQESLREHPDSAELHLSFGSLLYAAGRPDDADAAIDRALALSPDDLRPLRSRSEYRASTGRFDEAIGDARRYLEKRPNDSRMHFVLAVCEEGRGDVAAAIEAYRRAAELDRTAFAPRNNLAVLLADRDIDAAIAAAGDAYALAPENPAVLDTLGFLYLRKGLVPRATALLEQAHAASPESADVQYHLALAYRDGGRADDARRLLDDLGSRSGVPAKLALQVDEARRSLQ